MSMKRDIDIARRSPTTKGQGLPMQTHTAKALARPPASLPDQVTFI